MQQLLFGAFIPLLLAQPFSDSLVVEVQFICLVPEGIVYLHRVFIADEFADRD
jgi:hypothetical protein